MSIITMATSKGGAGKTSVARTLIGRMSLMGLRVAAVDADLTHALTDWVQTAWKPPASKPPVTVVHELDETQIVPLVSRLQETHDVVLIDTAGAATQATIFAIGCADLVLVPAQSSSADVVEAIKTMNIIKSASMMMKRDIPARVLLTAYQPGTNISEHVEREFAKAGLPVMEAKLTRLVAFQEMSFTGLVPTSGVAGYQCSKLLEEIEALGALPDAGQGTETPPPAEEPQAAPTPQAVCPAASLIQDEPKREPESKRRGPIPPYLGRRKPSQNPEAGSATPANDKQGSAPPNTIEHIEAEVGRLIAKRNSGRELTREEIEFVENQLAVEMARLRGQPESA